METTVLRICPNSNQVGSQQQIQSILLSKLDTNHNKPSSQSMELEIPRPQIKLSRRMKQQTGSFPEKWAAIASFIHALFESNCENLRGITKIQNLVRELCIKKLQARLEHEINIIFYNKFNQFVTELAKSTNNDAAWRLADFYPNLTKILALLSEIMQPLQITLLTDKEDRSLRMIVLRILNHEISNQSIVEESITETILQVVEDFREDKLELDERRRLLLRMSIQIGLFYKTIEPELIERSKTYYIHKRSRLPGNISFLAAIDHEIQKQNLLHQLIRPSEDIRLVIDKQLIYENLEIMLSFVEYLVNCQQYDDLSLIWRFLGRIGSRNLLERKIEDLIMAYDAKLSEGDVVAVIRYKLLVEAAISRSFDADKAMSRLVDNTFETLFSSHFESSSKAIVQYVLDHGHENAEPLSFEMFKCSPSADLLMRFYQFELARHILVQSPLLPKNLASHWSLVEKLTDFFGMNMTSKLSGMLADVYREGQERQAEKGPGGVFFARLLHETYWPKYKVNTMIFPDELRRYKDQFQSVYSALHPTQQLNWVNGLGRVTLSITGINVEVGEIQAAVIIILSKSIRPLLTHQLAEALDIGVDTLGPAVSELVEGQVLIQVAKNRYEFNWDGIQKFRSARQYEKPSDAIDGSAVARDRDIVVDAAIVKIVKRRKGLLKSELIKILSETIRQFRPTLEQIKRSLKNLSDRDTIELQGSQVRYRA